MTTAFPLAWPAGWPRDKGKMGSGSSKFYSHTYGPITFDRARQKLSHELDLLGAQRSVISTNLPLRQDGQPYAGAATKTMQDPGVAIYFTLKGKPMAMACDRFTDIAANMRSLGLAIDAMRQLDRHGGGVMMERAFSGFTALPPPTDWRKVMKFDPASRPSAADVNSQHRALAKYYHDEGKADDATMSDLNAARDAALREFEN